MEQKIILCQNLLYINSEEIILTDKEIKILHVLADNLLHRHFELINRLKLKRSFYERDNLRNLIYRTNKKTGLHIKALKKGIGYFLDERIFIVN